LISLSELDSRRFGVTVARATVIAADLGKALAFCRDNRVELLVARCAVREVAVAHGLEQAGARIMDTLVYYTRSLSSRRPPAAASTEATIRPGAPEDAEGVRAVAGQAFHRYLGHYHADPRLDAARADEAYVDWAGRALAEAGGSGAFQVADRAGRIVGFLAARLVAPDEADIALNAVVPELHGRGIYGALLAANLEWARSQGAARVVISTQLANLASQKALVRAGFEPRDSQYTFHLWFDPAATLTDAAGPTSTGSLR
jgi:GNAT superfamily N-acetyltransferase